MEESTLIFTESFPDLLKQDAEKVLKSKLSITESFKSSDSFAYLLESKTQKFVGKIHRFEHWPPKGKLEMVEKLLNNKNIPHEEIVYTSYNHSIFKFGWSISRYIPGGSARTLRDQGRLHNDKYFTKIGEVLSKVHQIKLNNFGSIQDKSATFKTFKELVKKEILDKDFENLPKDYLGDYQVIVKAKEWVLSKQNEFKWNEAVLVHDDINDGNVIWNNGNPALIDWTDSLAAVPVRDFATLTFRVNDPIIELIEEGYGQRIDREELKLHQIMRLIRLGHFYYFEDKDVNEFKVMMQRLNIILHRDQPFGI